MKSKKRNDRTTITKAQGWLPPAILFAITLAAYWNSFHVPFVFDDLLSIESNTGVRFGEVSWNFLKTRTVLYSTFTLNYIWTGREVWSYHFVNFILHLINGLLVFLLAERTFRRIEIVPERCRGYAGLAAALFLVHPLQTESVTYISSRSELLSTFFYLAALLIFLFWREDRIGFICSLAVGIAFFLGLGSKETVVTLPATIFLYDFLFLSGARLRPLLSRWRFYITFVIGGIGAIYYVLVVALRGVVGGGLYGQLPAWQYFLTELRVIVRYVQLIFIPVGLNLDHDVRPSASLLEPAVIGSFVFLCGLVFLAAKLRRGRPIFAFSILWFFITLSPTSSVVPIRDVIFEHRLYLPLVGVCLSFPFLVYGMYDFIRRRAAVPATAQVYAYVILAVFVTATVFRNQVWADEVRLWEDVVSKSPGKERGYSGLAFALYKRSDFNRAIQVLQQAREKLSEERLEFSAPLARMYLMSGKYSEALELSKQDVERLSGSLKAIAYNNLGANYVTEWDSLRSQRQTLSDQQFADKTEELLKPASEAYQNALKIDPNMINALDSYINVSFFRGMDREVGKAALEQLNQKEDFNTLYTVGKIAFLNKDYSTADICFERAEKLKPDVKLLFFNHGYALAELGHKDRAIQKYTEAIRIDPIFIEAHHNLALLLMAQKEYDSAAEHLAEVLRFDAKHISANLNLAKIYIAQGNKARARSHLATVLEVSPGNQQAATMLQQLGPS